MIQLNQNELTDLQNQDEDDDEVQVIDKESIGQWSFTDDDINSMIQGAQIQQSTQMQQGVQIQQGVKI